MESNYLFEKINQMNRAALDYLKNLQQVISNLAEEQEYKLSDVGCENFIDDVNENVLSKLDDGVGLVKISKDTGKPVKEIILNDKKPIYEVDEWGGFLYYIANNSSINAYDLNK